MGASATTDLADAMEMSAAAAGLDGRASPTVSGDAAEASFRVIEGRRTRASRAAAWVPSSDRPAPPSWLTAAPRVRPFRGADPGQDSGLRREALRREASPVPRLCARVSPAAVAAGRLQVPEGAPGSSAAPGGAEAADPAGPPAGRTPVRPVAGRK